ncbi:hypothetical protein [Cryptosporangium arvum]|uniref:hypothetical protein n=1 Tax=Cryptosporangium arvum TaxID=80871 RepID=UPI0004AD8268|nr:hypothetical protein [Cryptosporangium arvum]
MDETTTRLLFHQVSASAPPAADVDLRRVVRRAERRRRRRQRGLAAMAAAVVLVVTGGVALLATGLGADRTPPARPAGPDVTYGPPLTVAPTAFDPLRHAIQVSGLPSGLPFVIGRVTRDEAFYLASRTYSGDDYRVRLAARGHPLEEESGLIGRVSVPGPEIHGRPSRWYTSTKDARGQATHELRWEWAPGARASVRLGDQPDALGVAARIAESARMTATPLRLPYTADVPAPFRPSAAGSSWRGRDLSTFSLEFDDPATGSVLGIGVASNSLTLDFEPNTEIHDQPGQTKRDGNFARVRVRQPTVQFGLDCDDKPYGAQSVGVAMARCVAVAESIDLVANPLRPDTWPRATVR